MIPERAISIQQPWSLLIVKGHKDIENRDWSTRYRGPVLIHAGRKIDEDAFGVIRKIDPAAYDAIPKTRMGYQIGGIVGIADIVDCVTESASPWFFGRFGFVLANARPLPITPVPGQLGFFKHNLERVNGL